MLCSWPAGASGAKARDKGKRPAVAARKAAGKKGPSTAKQVRYPRGGLASGSRGRDCSASRRTPHAVPHATAQVMKVKATKAKSGQGRPSTSSGKAAQPRRL
eukprot:281354-Chlamydomonas_euryale.AAC.2